jgi:hypothetical protein
MDAGIYYDVYQCSYGSIRIIVPSMYLFTLFSFHRGEAGEMKGNVYIQKYWSE